MGMPFSDCNLIQCLINNYFNFIFENYKYISFIFRRNFRCSCKVLSLFQHSLSIFLDCSLRPSSLFGRHPRSYTLYLAQLLSAICYNLLRLFFHFGFLSTTAFVIFINLLKLLLLFEIYIEMAQCFD